MDILLAVLLAVIFAALCHTIVYIVHDRPKTKSLEKQLAIMTLQAEKSAAQLAAVTKEAERLTNKPDYFMKWAEGVVKSDAARKLKELSKK